MKRVFKSFGSGLVVLVFLVSLGCSPELKALALNQVVGFASSITSALATSIIQSMFSTGSDNTTAQ